MRVLLRNEETHLYCDNQDGWVAESTQAVDFGGLERAGRKALQWQKLNLSVVLVYDNPKCELALNPVFCISEPRTGGVSIGA